VAARLFALGVTLSAAQAATLKSETTKAWEDYIAGVSEGIHERATAAGFLQMYDRPAVAVKVHRGQIVVSPAGAHIPKKVPSGLIHDWMGATFIPNTTLKDVLAVLRDYNKYREMYAPHVIASKMISVGETTDEFSIVLMNKTVIAKTALDFDYETLFARVDDRRMYSITQSKRIQEIADYGTARERKLAEGEGTGLIWRLFSVSRFEERDGGLCVETEAIALSRDIPAALRVVVEPVVRRISRESLETALQQTAHAVHAVGVARRLAPGNWRTARPKSVIVRRGAPSVSAPIPASYQQIDQRTGDCRDLSRRTFPCTTERSIAALTG
jgi:hypothetical protein